MLSFLRRTLGRRSIRKHAEKARLREAQRATTHIPAAGDAKSIITCRVSLLDGTDVSVDLPGTVGVRYALSAMPTSMGPAPLSCPGALLDCECAHVGDAGETSTAPMVPIT
eukprot:superscaffoldBa00008314_g23249